MDDWTARLIVQLQLEDLGAVVPEDTHRAPGPRPDDYIAGRVYKHELTRCEADVSSRKLGEDLEDDDNDAEGAREAAAFGWRYDEYRNVVEKEPEPEPEPVKLTACMACGDDYPPGQIAQMPCTHNYCKDCLEGLYWSCMTDEALFPPRCCHQEFPWELAKSLLTQRCRSKFRQKRIELVTTDRTYCHVSSCSAFIPPSTYWMGSHRGIDVAPCPDADLGHPSTCVRCKNASHFGACPRDAAKEQLMDTAALNGWKACYSCHRLIELQHGCNHMTCICKTEFCYVCGQQWKTCACLQWDEDRLLERAEEVVDNMQAPAVNHHGAEDREDQVARAVQHLREHHECDHDEIKGIREVGREYQCETCNETYHNWIYQCRQCWMIICNRCRHNRL